MKYLLITLLFVGVGCTSVSSVIPTTDDSGGGIPGGGLGDPSSTEETRQDDTHVPVVGELTYKGFGEYFEDRFSGYHVGIDLEASADTPVYAIADGEVTYSGVVSGYGGVIVVRHTLEDRAVSAIYGHLDPASMVALGEEIKEGGQLAVLGEEGEETDGEREHLHVAMYQGDDVRVNGYETNAERVERWLNPVDELGSWFSRTDRRASDLEYAQGEELFKIDFDIPDGWDIEYIPSIQSLNLYTVYGAGTARDRSQMLIRYFDASAFLTLSTVTIHSVEDLTVGIGDYVARRYDIEKKSGVADFADQPAWRNDRHLVTDFRFADGYTRYYVVAKNPEVDMTVYEAVLNSMSAK